MQCFSLSAQCLKTELNQKLDKKFMPYHWKIIPTSCFCQLQVRQNVGLNKNTLFLIFYTSSLLQTGFQWQSDHSMYFYLVYIPYCPLSSPGPSKEDFFISTTLTDNLHCFLIKSLLKSSMPLWTKYLWLSPYQCVCSISIDYGMLWTPIRQGVKWRPHISIVLSTQPLQVPKIKIL